MPYDANNDPYLDKATGVLRNKLGATDSKTLDEIETTITSAMLANLQLPSDFKPEFDQLLGLHAWLFGDIFDWAGEIRTIDISKKASYFCSAPFIHSSLVTLFSELGNDTGLTSTNKSEFVSSLAHYYSELNAIHPFREGNGRTIRAFLSLMSEYYGWEIDWSTLNQTENQRASISAFSGNESDIKSLMLPIVGRRQL